MESDNSLKKYIKLSPARIIAVVFFVMASIACLIGAIYTEMNYVSPDPVRFSKNLDEHEYCYVDVQYLTKWLVKDDHNTYYCAKDKYGTQFTISIYDEDLPQFQKIIDFTYSQDEDSVEPAPIRITGRVHKITSENADQMAKAWGINRSQYYTRFGYQVFYAGQSVPSQVSTALLILSIFLLPLSAVLIIAVIRSFHKFNKSMKVMEQNGELQKAEYEFNQPERYIYNKLNTIFTENYIIMKNKGIIVNYNDVEWFFKRVQTVNGIMSTMELVVYTLKYGQIHVINVAHKKKLQDDLYFLMDLIASKNPNAIGGYSPAANKEYKRRRKEYKLRNKNMY